MYISSVLIKLFLSLKKAKFYIWSSWVICSVPDKLFTSDNSDQNKVWRPRRRCSTKLPINTFHKKPKRPWKQRSRTRRPRKPRKNCCTIENPFHQTFFPHKTCRLTVFMCPTSPGLCKTRLSRHKLTSVFDNIYVTGIHQKGQILLDLNNSHISTCFESSTKALSKFVRLVGNC